MRLQSTTALLLVCLLFIFSSCSKKDGSGAKSEDTIPASDNALAEGISNDVMSVSTQSEDNGIAGSAGDTAYGYLLGACATITVNLTASPYLLTIDYGTTNCLCYDGKNRRGKILVSYTGLYREEGSKHTITFDNYYVNDYKVEGSITVTNEGRNTAGNMYFAVEVNEVITDQAGRKLTYTSSRTREWIAGESTQGLGKWLDDVYSITGTASGTGFTGTQFTSEITSPLIVALNCLWIKSGKIDFKPSTGFESQIDFGNGDCDNTVTVIIAGITFNVILP